MKYYPRHGEAFICEGAQYSEVHLYIAHEKDGNLIAQFFKKPKFPGEPPIDNIPVKDLPGPFFPSIFSFRLKHKVPIDLEEKKQLYDLIEKNLKSLLSDAPSQRMELNIAQSKISNKTNIEPELVSVIFKTLIAEKIAYQYSHTQKDEYIEFTELKRNSENSKKYYGSLAQEIKIKSDQISLLTSHGQTAGNYREHILRSLLEKYLPARFAVGTGFIDGIARQLDIIIYDKTNFPVIFREGDLVVVHRESVRGIIEVKTTLDYSKIKDSLQLFYDIFRAGIFKPILPIFKGIYAFNTTFETTQKVARTIRNFYTKPYFESQLKLNMTRVVQYLFHEITGVCVLNEHFLFTKYAHYAQKDSEHLVPSLYSINEENGLDVQTAAFIALLFDYLDGDFYSKRTAQKGFSDLMSTESVEVKFESHIADRTWIPRTKNLGEHDYTQKSIALRLEEIKKWRKGDLSSSEYIKKIETMENAERS